MELLRMDLRDAQVDDVRGFIVRHGGRHEQNTQVLREHRAPRRHTVRRKRARRIPRSVHTVLEGSIVAARLPDRRSHCGRNSAASVHGSPVERRGLPRPLGWGAALLLPGDGSRDRVGTNQLVLTDAVCPRRALGNLPFGAMTKLLLWWILKRSRGFLVGYKAQVWLFNTPNSHARRHAAPRSRRRTRADTP